MKKLSRGQKAWKTRKASTFKAKVKPSEPQTLISKRLDNSLDRLEQRMADYINRVDRILE